MAMKKDAETASMSVEGLLEVLMEAKQSVELVMGAQILVLLALALVPL